MFGFHPKHNGKPKMKRLFTDFSQYDAHPIIPKGDRHRKKIKLFAGKISDSQNAEPHTDVWIPCRNTLIEHNKITHYRTQNSLYLYGTYAPKKQEEWNHWFITKYRPFRRNQFCVRFANTILQYWKRSSKSAGSQGFKIKPKAYKTWIDNC